MLTFVPCTNRQSAFEIFIIFCVLYSAIVEPLKVTYMLTILPTIDDFLDLVFAFDILFQCFCGYHDSGGQRFPVLQFHLVVANYCRTWFLIDLIAAIPVDRFFPVSEPRRRASPATNGPQYAQ